MTMKDTSTRAIERLVAEMPEGDRWREVPCCVRAETAGGPCGRPSVIRVYGLVFCEVHGAECKADALEELYYDAEKVLARLDSPHVEPINPEALRIIRAGISEINRKSWQVVEAGDEARREAYPLRRELMDEDFRDFDYEDPENRDTLPEDWCRNHLMTIHKLMRIAFEEGATYAVEGLEADREHVSAQLAYAIQDAERKRSQRAGSKA